MVDVILVCLMVKVLLRFMIVCISPKTGSLTCLTAPVRKGLPCIFQKVAAWRTNPNISNKVIFRTLFFDERYNYRVTLTRPA